MAILPIKTRIRGPAQSVRSILQLYLQANTHITIRTTSADPEQADIVDETLDLFRANSLFRNFEIKGPADRLLILLILSSPGLSSQAWHAKTVLHR